MGSWLPDIAERARLDGRAPQEAAEDFAADAARFPRHPRVNIEVARRNLRTATAQVRFLLREKPAASLGGRDCSREVAVWRAVLTEWRAVRQTAQALVRDCQAAAEAAEEHAQMRRAA